MSEGLVYIGRIVSIVDVPNSDTLGEATVDCLEGGTWHGVVKRGQFKVDDLVETYLQDSVLPREPRFMFMEPRHFRVRICRLRGALSEALIMPIDGTHFQCSHDQGEDITELVGVRKYERALPANMNGKAKGNFPSFLKMTDEPNIQRSQKLVDALKGQPYVVTLKLDGSSVTFYKHEGTFGVCSRRLDLQDGESLFWQVARKQGLEAIPDGYAVQAELVGPGIQGNPLGLTEAMAVAFNVFEIAHRRYLNHDDAVAFLANHVPAMSWVPVLEMGASFESAKAEGREYPNKRSAEGIVVRPLVEQYVGNERLSFKVLNPLYKEAG